MEEVVIKGTRFNIDEKAGYTIETANGEILSIRFPGDRRIFHVGQKVAASGRIKGYFPKRGIEGTIVTIDNPFAGRFGSSDVIRVLFEGYDYPLMMKAKDLA